MKISTKGRYGLRVMIELAAHYGQGPLLVDTIARNQDISAKYIHVLMAGLKSGGFIRSMRGPSGGYELAMPPERITALEVVRTLEGDLAPVDCVTDAAACTRSHTCATRDMWCEVGQAVAGVLSGYTLAELARRQADKTDNQAPAYAI